MPSRINLLVTIIKSLTGANSMNLSKHIEIKPKPRWPTYGKATLVLGLSHELSRRLGLPEKKTYGYCERDEAKRQVFVEQLRRLCPKQIVYVDESGMDSRDDYAYGWKERGERFHALKCGRRQNRINMIPALCDQHLLAPFTVDGACNRTVFETWVETCLLPLLKAGQVVVETWVETCLLPLLKAGQVVVMDNATFHKGGRIEQLIQQAGCEVLYLPAYSPDLNQIERCWSYLKSRIRKQLAQFECLRDAIEHVLCLAS